MPRKSKLEADRSAEELFNFGQPVPSQSNNAAGDQTVAGDRAEADIGTGKLRARAEHLPSLDGIAERILQLLEALTIEETGGESSEETEEATGVERVGKKKINVRASLAEAIAAVAGVSVELVDIRTYGRTGQAEVRSGESIGRRFYLEKQKGIAVVPDWVLVGMVTAPSQKTRTQLQVHQNLMNAVEPWITGVCTAAVFLSRIGDEWTLARVYQTVGHEKVARRFAEAFGRGPEEIRNLSPVKTIAPLPTLDGERPKLDPAPPFTIAEALQDLFLSQAEFEQMLSDWRRKKSLILQGPPGVGKTFIAKRLAFALLGAKDEARVTTVQFHQSTSYEDFVRGWRPAGADGFRLEDGVFYLFCDKARGRPDEDFIFMIDEINRANLSKVLGELLMLLEADKRDSDYAVPLTYRHTDREVEEFFVPPNVYVLGMMNTADRSLAMVDFALRRRFAFHDVKPAFDHHRFTSLLQERGVDDDTITRVKERIGELNKVISEDTKNLGPGFEIGHSFFCPRGRLAEGGSEAWYQSVIDAEIAPLLREYWFDAEEEAQKHIDALKAPSHTGDHQYARPASPLKHVAEPKAPSLVQPAGPAPEGVTADDAGGDGGP